MKKIVVILLALLWLIPVAEAVPARPDAFKHKQPDGTVITIRLHGDELYHWTTDESGKTVEMDSRGFFRRVNVSQEEHRNRAARARRNAMRRAGRWSSYENQRETNFGTRKILCILAEFVSTDEVPGSFTVENPNQHFYNMLNQHDYSYNGAIGSVKDYYVDNSGGLYNPEFDVYGPVLLSQTSAYYDQNGVDLAIMEAYELLKDQIGDMSIYDTDRNGAIDMVLFYYPWHNQAEGAPEDTIWPHQLGGSFGQMGGYAFNRYFCTSELRGTPEEAEQNGPEAASIGTTCHEFGHSLGLPDFYDVDYEEHGENDKTTWILDLMASGSYNDKGRQPPQLSAVERNMLGWMDYPPVITEEGNYTLKGIQNNEAYRIDSRIPGEYFILEGRTAGGKWDDFLVNTYYMRGLVLYHIDKSQRLVYGNYSAAYLWENTNDINSYGGHPCYYVVPSVANAYYTNDYVFPGAKAVRTWEPMDWDNNSVGMELTDISFDGTQVSFSTHFTQPRQIFGYVKDGYGQPIENATVYLSLSSYAFQAPAFLSTDTICETDEQGYYQFDLESDASPYQIVSVRKEGCFPESYNVKASGLFSRQDFILMELGQAPPASLQKYSEEGTASNYALRAGGLGSGDIAAGMRYSAEELLTMGAVGAKITEITFASGAVGAESGESIYVLVDIGGERKLLKDVTSVYRKGYYISVDVSDENVIIPADKDVYIGYGVANLQTSHPFYMYGPTEGEDGGNYYLTDFLSSNSWTSVRFTTGYCDFLVSAMLAPSVAVDFAAYGVSYVELVDGVPQVVPAAGKTVYSVSWYLDGESIETPGAVSELSAGAHTFMARVTHYDGTSERVYYDVTKE